MAKCLMIVFGLMLIPVLSSGCSTLVDSPKERAYNAGKVANYGVMEFNEDFDDFWLIDQPSHMSYWMIR